MLSGKVMKIHLIVEMITKCHCIKWVFVQNHLVIRDKIKVELDLSYYATKSDIKR